MDIWPRPTHLSSGHEQVWLSQDVGYSLSKGGSKAGYKPEIGIDTLVREAFERCKGLIFDSENIHLKQYNLMGLQQPHGLPSNPIYIEKVAFELTEVDTVLESSSELYSLELDTLGECRVQFRSIQAFHRAMATFVQLFQGSTDGRARLCCPVAPLKITDSPVFQHRGLNLDISRSTIYPYDIFKVLDGMWLNKMNKLHIHATDSQSWPLEVPSIPDLAQKGAYSRDQIWTVRMVKDIQEHGEKLGIEVYFEIDLPGHTASIHQAFPELIVAFKQEPWVEYAMQPPAGQLKLDSEAVRNFMQCLFDDVLPRVAQHSTLFHIGGDEFNRKCYTLEESIKSDSKKVLQPLLQKFFTFCVEHLQKHKLTPVLWEDALLEWDIELPENTIFQSWKSQESLAQIVKKGHRALFGPCQYWYLDCGFGSFLDPDPNNADTPIKDEFRDWCGPYKNWRRVYTYNPYEGLGETDKAKILGGEVHLWAELTDSMSLDWMLWPRAAAAAEVLWSGPDGQLDEHVTRRLANMRERLTLLGIRPAVVQNEWSLRNPGCTSL